MPVKVYSYIRLAKTLGINISDFIYKFYIYFLVDFTYSDGVIPVIFLKVLEK